MAVCSKPPSSVEFEEKISSLRMRMHLMLFGVAALCVGASACHNNANKNLSPIVGTWIVKCPEAPFPYHMFMFHADGTMQQSNPDAGDPSTSDSSGMGAWVSDGEKVKGKFVEVTADRTTRHFVSRGEISFEVNVEKNAFRGSASAVFFDAEGKRFKAPLSATLEGERIVP
jgi:hypothetical protein